MDYTIVICIPSPTLKLNCPLIKCFILSVTGLPHDTLRTTTCSHYTLPTLYNLTLVKYGKSLAEYSRILCVAADSILPHIAAHCLYIAVVSRTWQNIAEYSRRYALALSRVLCII